jgi:multidrug efflux pump subunit AcrA (membrane-fusion protein)
VDATTRLGEVRSTLEGPGGLRSGLFGGGVLETEQRMALTVPLTAVLSDTDGDYVQVVRDGVVERRPVTPGLVWQGRREIVSGLDEGEAVIERSGAFFRDGDHVRPIEPEPQL